MATSNILFAGFGGQGILFAGKVLAYAGMIENKHVSWLPSYGPEMRGGTANCSVCVSDDPIGSPLVVLPDILVVMNVQSYDKFIGKVAPGGIAIVDSALVDKKCDRTDITVHYLPATSLAGEEHLEGLANIIMLGKLLGASGLFKEETIQKAIEKCVPASKKHLLEPNLRAISVGEKQ